MATDLAYAGLMEPAAPSREGRRAGPDLSRLALLACWVLMAGLVLTVGERPSSAHRLEQQVRMGEVTSVVVGPAGVPVGRGYGRQEVRWREGWQRHRAEVMMWNADRAGAASSADGVALREGRDVALRLRDLDPSLTVTRTSARHDTQVYDWYVPRGVGVAGLVLVLLTIGLLITGPPTWRATKWAWFWLMATPVGLLAYLVLSGPTPGIPAPRYERPSLRGGWGFVLAIVMASFLPSWWH